MAKLFIEDLNVSGKKVLMRLDFNVPLDPQLQVVDSTRIEAALPSIQYVLRKGGTPILMSHLGRPRGEHNLKLSLAPVAKHLALLLNKQVELAPDCIGEDVRRKVKSLKPGEILLLENLRFHQAEEHPDEDLAFAKELASYGDCYVNDAFGTAHRKHSSTYSVPTYFPRTAAAGYLMEKEIQLLQQTLFSPVSPFYAVIGGAKISTKIGVIQSLLKKVDRLLIGGGMGYTFLKALGMNIGSSLIEENLVPVAKALLKEWHDKMILPLDCVAATKCSQDAPSQIFKFSGNMPDTYQGLDIGPATIKLFNTTLSQAKTILWNGPLGVYEIEKFAQGTYSVARHLAAIAATKIIGGGDLIAAIKKADLSDSMTHISTGGGATLEYIEHGTLPCIEVLSEKGQF